jgi:DNA-binding transcriptional LysR family regulator
MTAFDDLELLRAFVRIVESGTISAAARSLKLPQPTLSRHLRALEDRAGTTLLLRDTHRMRLTEAGHRLIADARALLTLADEAADRLHDDRTELRGHLRVFATVDLGQSGLSRLVARFLLEHPGVTAELGYSNRPVQMIEDGYDLGVVAGDVTDETVVARNVGTIHRILAASPEYLASRPRVKSLDDLRGHAWVALGQRQFGGRPDSLTLLGPSGASRSLRIAPVLVSEGVTSLREAVLERAGISVLPLWLVQGDLASGALARVLPDWHPPPLALSALYLAQRALPARVRAFLDFVAMRVGGELDPPRAARRR